MSYINYEDNAVFNHHFGELFGSTGLKWNQHLMRWIPEHKTLMVFNPSKSIRLEVKRRLGEWWISIYDTNNNKLLVSLSWRGRVGNLRWLIVDGVLDDEGEFFKCFLYSKVKGTPSNQRDLLGLHHGGSTGGHKLFRGGRHGVRLFY